MKDGRLMKYKGFFGSAEFSFEDMVLFGKIECINDLVTYESVDINGLEAAFHEAVDDYIQTCKELGKEAEKPFSGTFNIRIGADAHKKAYIKSLDEGISLNELIKKSIESYTDGQKEVHMHIHTEIRQEAVGNFSAEKITMTSKPQTWKQQTIQAVH